MDFISSTGKYSGRIIGLFFLSISFASAEESTPLNVNIENGLRISTADGANSMLFGGYLLFDTIPLDDNNSRSPRFDLFNAWIFVVGKIDRYFDYKIQYSIDDASGKKIRDAYMSFDINVRNRLRLGHFDVPTYAEHLSALSYTPLAGRSIVDNLAPGRDVGVMLSGDYSNNAFNYSLGIFNGNGVDSNGEDNWDKDYALRLTGRIVGSSDKSDFRIYPDFSFSGGMQNGDDIRFRSETGTSLLTATALPIDDRFRVTASLYAMLNSFTFRSDYALGEYHFEGTEDKGRVSAFSVLLSYYLSGETDTYKGGLFQKTNPLKPYGHGTGMGAWQVVFRYSRLDVSQQLVNFAGAHVNASSVQNASAANAYSVGMNWLPSGNTRVNLSVMHIRFDLLSQSALGASENSAVLRFTLQYF